MKSNTSAKISRIGFLYPTVTIKIEISSNLESKTHSMEIFQGHVAFTFEDA